LSDPADQPVLVDAAAPTAVGAGPARWRRWLRAVLPWAVGAGILTVVFHRLPLDALLAALTRGPWPLLAAYVAAEIGVVLLADGWAASVALRRSGGALSYWRIVSMRGATYLFQILHVLAGQGSFGWFLARAGGGAWRAGGVVVLLLATQLLALALVGVLGLLAAPAWLRGPALPAVALVAGGMLVYLVVVRLRPAWLAKLQIAQPLFAAGVRGHLVTVAARLPHVALLVLWHWGAFWLWGIHIPFLVAAAYIPPMLFVTALPITPAGLGTVQALQMALFAGYAAGATPGEREAAVVAFSLAHLALALLVQAVIGLACLRSLRAQPARSPA
jgi:hypothetical protein